MVEKEEITIYVCVCVCVCLCMCWPFSACVWVCTVVLGYFGAFIPVWLSSELMIKGNKKLLFSTTAKDKPYQFTLYQLQFERHIWSDKTTHSEKPADIFEYLLMQAILLSFIDSG